MSASDTPRLCHAHFSMHDVVCRKGCGDTCVAVEPEKVNAELAAANAKLAEEEYQHKITATDAANALAKLREYESVEVPEEPDNLLAWLRDQDCPTHNDTAVRLQEVWQRRQDAANYIDTLLRAYKALAVRLREAEMDAQSEGRWATHYGQRAARFEEALRKIDDTAKSFPYAGNTCGDIAREALAVKIDTARKA